MMMTMTTMMTVMSVLVDDQAEHDRLVGLGARFAPPPIEMGPVTSAVFDDTGGNSIQLAAWPG